MKILVLNILSSLFLIACGGGSGDSNSGSNTQSTGLSYVEVNEQIFNGDREVVGVLSDGTETLTIIENPNIGTISELYYNSGSGTETALIYTINSDGLPSKVSAHDGTYIEFNYPAIDTSPTTLNFYNANNNLVYETTATIDINVVKQAYSDLTNTQSSSISLSSVKTITSKNLAQAQTTTTCVTKDREYQCESAEPIEISPQTSRYINYGIIAISAVTTAVTITEAAGITLALGITNLIYLKTRLVVASLGVDINNIPALQTTDNILTNASCLVLLNLNGCITQGLQVLKNTIFVVTPTPVTPTPVTPPITPPTDDTTPPVITLNGDNPLNLSVGDTYTELGATADDEVDGSVAVSINGNVDTSTSGTYEITYSATDIAGSTATKIRTINVAFGVCYNEAEQLVMSTVNFLLFVSDNLECAPPGSSRFNTIVEKLNILTQNFDTLNKCVEDNNSIVTEHITGSTNTYNSGYLIGFSLLGCP